MASKFKKGDLIRFNKLSYLPKTVQVALNLPSHGAADMLGIILSFEPAGIALSPDVFRIQIPAFNISEIFFMSEFEHV